MDKWVEIDLNKLQHNVKALQGYFDVPIMAVLKQNAYGLGAVKIGNFLEQSGINHFAVTHIEEGIELRDGGVRSPILVFAPPGIGKDELNSLWRHELTPSVYSLHFAEILNRLALEKDKPIDVHLKVDTGMGRMGFTPQELLQAAERLKELDGLNLKGIFTHYSNAFEKEMDYTKEQLDSFLSLVNQLENKGFEFTVKYSANSMAALKFPATHMDMVNIGSAFLGNSTINPDVPLKKVYRTRVRVLQARQLEEGSYVGYSNTYKTGKNTHTAVLPIGYTDGFGLEKKIDSFRINDFIRQLYHLLKDFLKPAYSVFFDGKPLKIIGKTSMQLTVVETGNVQLKPGDIVDVYLNPLMANARIDRVYVEGQPD
ncbi:MAG: alanine racemase [Firmicutes bacterium]|nr:alanine racemase [Bacillota bacterium]